MDTTSEVQTSTEGRSKVPALNKADIAAVRSFLPGKLLGRTAALLALLLLVLHNTAAVDTELKRLFAASLRPTWLYHALLFGVPLLIVIIQVYVEWQAKRNRQRAQQMALRTERVPSGYFRIGPYVSGSARPFPHADFSKA